MLTIKRGKDKRVVRALLINVMDLPDGIAIKTAELVAGTRLMEGTVIGVGADGFGHVIKTAKVYEAADNAATAYKVVKGSHFKQGDFIALGKGKTAKTVVSVNRDNAAYDVITVDATLGTAVKTGDVLVAAKAAAASAAFSVAPKAMLAQSYEVDGDTNLFVAAVTCGQFKEALVPPVSADIKEALRLIDFV